MAAGIAGGMAAEPAQTGPAQTELAQTGYALAATARILEDSTGRFRIRTGVWNFEEAAIDVSQEPPAVARTVQAALRALAGGAITIAGHLDPELLPVERANVEKLFADLAQAGILVPEPHRQDQDAITAALLGRLSPPYPGTGEPPGRPVLFWSDRPAATDQARALAASLRLELVPVPEELAGQLARADLTSRIDGYQTETGTAALRAELAAAAGGDPAALVTCFQRPSLPVLRNLNRLLEGQDLPWVSGFVDGPFVSVVGVKSPYTGCFECFEQRSLARLEDHITYHEFARSPVGTAPERDQDAPLLYLLTGLAVTEGYLHAAVGSSRLSGRALSVHLPTFEIQAQDLLRMPNCPACGRVSQQRLQEVNFNSRAVVDRIVGEVLQ